MSKLIDIVVPVFNEQENLENLVGAVEKEIVSVEPKYRFNLILIDDGSRDGSWNLIQQLANRKPWITGIRLSRNFGPHAALTAGFFHANGDALITLACDLQDPPSTCRDFIREWEQGRKIVWGARVKRRDAFWRIATSEVYTWVVKKLLPKTSMFTTGSFFLVDAKVKDCFKQFKERRRLTFALVAWTGFDQSRVGYVRNRREFGKSGWTISKMLMSLNDTIVAYSDWPAKFMTWLGFFVCIFSMAFMGYSIFCWLEGNPQKGWTSLVTLISGFHGLSFLMFGMFGQYLGRIYLETIERPLYFVSESVGGNHKK